MPLRDLVDPFPNLLQGSTLHEGELYRAMRCKYVMRNLLEGGPILQPDFALIQPVAGYVASLLQVNPEAVLLQHPPERFIDERHQFSPAAIASAVATGELLPTVYKPNRGAWGRGVTLLDGTPEVITLTTNHLSGAYQRRSESEKLTRYLGDRLGAEVSIDIEHHRAQFTIRAPPGEREMLLMDALLLLGTASSAQTVCYDPGMIERTLPFFKPGGRAYETRHRFMGNLRTGEFLIGKGRDDTTQGGAAQIGSNAEFVHVHDCKHPNDGRTLTWEERYDPLFTHGRFTTRNRATFVGTIDEMLTEEFAHLATRLRSAGIGLETADVQGEFDLQWIFRHGKRFPTPTLIEARIIPAAVYQELSEGSRAFETFRGQRVRVRKPKAA